MHLYRFKKGHKEWELAFPDDFFAANHAKYNKADRCMDLSVGRCICELKPNGIGGYTFKDYSKVINKGD